MEAGATSPAPRTYRAFLSYSHADRDQVRKLHHALETYRIPAKLVGTNTPVGAVPRRLTPIFRDREELPASADLGGQLTAALDNSQFLVVLCSPASARSHWVNEEIKHFKRTKGEGRVLALVLSGEPYASKMAGREAEECFPPALRFRLGPDGELSDSPAEPIAADQRSHADGVRLARLKLIAGLTGLPLDDIVQREAQRRIQQMSAVVAASLAGVAVTGGLAIYATQQRIEAQAQRRVAEQEAAAARASADFLIETFALSNPATDNPRTVTAFSILERSGERVTRELSGQPRTQARLLATLGTAYNSLGLAGETVGTLAEARQLLKTVRPDGAEALTVLATSYVLLGRLDDAERSIRDAREVLGAEESPDATLAARVEMAEGWLRRAQGEMTASAAAYDRAAVLLRGKPNSLKLLCLALMNEGQALSEAGRYDQAETVLAEALATARRALGDRHLVTGQTWSALAQNAMLSGRPELAERRVAEALAVQRVVLDPDNPRLADVLSLQGQIYKEAGKLPEAERSLRQAVAVYEDAYDGPHYAIGIAQVYLAMIESERGRSGAALATLADARRNYDASYRTIHPNHGDLLVHRAMVLARAGRRTEADADCAAGLKILDETLGASDPFVRSLAETCRSLPGPATPARS